MEKTGLVLEGGGVRGAYTAGALAWLIDNNIVFDYAVGISSGAVYLCMYEMKEKELLYKTATTYSSDPANTGLKAFAKEKHYVAYSHLFQDNLLGKEGWDLQPLIDANPDIEVGAYDLNQGKTIWFNAQDLDTDLKLIHATCGLPVASAVVEIDGKRLLDGGITKMIPIERAVEKGCTKFLVITTKPKDYVRKPASSAIKFLMKHTYKDCPQVSKDYEVRHINYYKQREIIDDLEKEGKACHILPSQTIKVSRFKGDLESCKKLFALGYQDMEDRKEEIFSIVGVNNG